MENIENLKDADLIEINGGSELSDAIWYGIGYVFGSVATMMTPTAESLATSHQNGA